MAHMAGFGSPCAILGYIHVGSDSDAPAIDPFRSRVSVMLLTGIAILN